MMLKDLVGKKVLVTGGSKGIGKDIALTFAKLGSRLVVTGRNENTLKECVNELQEHNPYCTYVVADIQKTHEIRSMVDEAVELMDGIDVLINNAGVNIAKPALEVTEEDWDAVLDTNLKGSFFCAQRAGHHMIPKQQGKIITIVSQMAFVGYIKRAAYCSSKGGAVQMTKALAVEWAQHNVKVNAVAPTFIETELTSKMFEDEAFHEDVMKRIPLGKLAQPSDVTGAVVYLASDMANFVTGETLKVDGGWTAI
ncbi:glucose 1-dehydrogenase [Bacillus sp. Cs-700]|uniref:SDR family NAD(P)-dependent oxidoreductase n=1 Tax=Bacillus sp. Cs-700 TaxID=2589818 RepID=UPI00140B2AF7|nr:glucose 1-dehydrogenase [Bacillus sp. Cs-700]